MAWTEITRPKYQRDELRYASDTTDEEWALIEPHIPPPASCGRTRETSMREVVNSIFYIPSSGYSNGFAAGTLASLAQTWLGRSIARPRSRYGYILCPGAGLDVLGRRYSA